MYRQMIGLMFLLISQTTLGEGAVAQNEAGGDQRQLVTMPAESRELMRQQMLVNLATLNAMIGYLAENNLDAAAEAAETNMGRGTMGKYRGTGMGPGRYMPVAMRDIALSMHDAASEFSKVAKQGDVSSTYSALQKVSSSCVACHYSYRTR